jgi:uroporphyrin-III C-methyltransferase
MTEQQKPEEKQSRIRKSTGIVISGVAIAFIACFGYGYFELSKVNIQLAHMVADVQNRTASGQSDIEGLKTSVNSMQQSLQKTQDLSAQQEKIMSDWRAAQQGDLNKWHAAEAQQLTKMANEQLQFMQNAKMAVVLLQQADKELQNAQDSALLEIRKSLTSDVTNLQALPQVDVTSIFMHLNALNDLVDKLPLPVNPLKSDTSQTPAAPVSGQTSWWKSGLDSAWEGLSKIVIVRKYETGALPLVLPEEKIFLYQNLHAQIENAVWGLLHNNPAIYTASLGRAAAWIKQYFVQDAQETKTLLQNLAELQKVNIQPPVSSLGGTLQLFDNYFAQDAVQKS